MGRRGPWLAGHVRGRVSHGPWAPRASVSRFWGALELSNLKGKRTAVLAFDLVLTGMISLNLQ